MTVKNNRYLIVETIERASRFLSVRLLCQGQGYLLPKGLLLIVLLFIVVLSEEPETENQPEIYSIKHSLTTVYCF
jgi:hypothetical protein